MAEDITFMKITNRDIYKKIEDFICQNALDHKKIMEHQIKTNGKVKLNRWISATALTLIFAIALKNLQFIK